ncbi:MAG TPA: SDR family NAD(P)-dependent oxidoreductase, partial [Bacteroidia bacterium]|nr:SDR family NAD(P)-dependent oxidoreductase [Bacteroidia bacterium]
DILVNNAGTTSDALFARLPPEAWDRVLDTNLKGAFLCAKAAARIMVRQRRGHIVQIGSYSALHPPVGQTAYAASKAGLIGLTKSLAKELGPRNLRINCVLPGFLETRMTAGLPDAARVAALEKHALGRFNTVEDAA